MPPKTNKRTPAGQMVDRLALIRPLQFRQDSQEPTSMSVTPPTSGGGDFYIVSWYRMQTISSEVRGRNQPSVSGYFETNTDACGEVSTIDR